MDIQEVLNNKIKSLPAGDHLAGLKAVKLHIDSAVRHLTRGQSDEDETLFTDVIFRCNQAFEGSIKEAYRVLAGKDPQGITPADIEKFLASANLLRKKVLDQFTIYRREWRNPQRTTTRSTSMKTRRLSRLYRLRFLRSFFVTKSTESLRLTQLQTQ